MPHAKPIISDDTVAALTGASDWPNITLTGSVDCRNKPPMASMTTNVHPDSSGDATRNGVDSDKRQRDDPPRTESVRSRTAEEAADAAREEIERDHCARPDRATGRVASSSPGTNVANDNEASVRRTTIR